MDKFSINAPFNAGQSYMMLRPYSSVSYVHKIASSTNKDTYLTYSHDGSTSIIETHKIPQGNFVITSRLISWLPKWPFWGK
jgi:uncharacterized protein YhjY with autotransporter beta-barrel domain